jgi:hypothetical protein
MNSNDFYYDFLTRSLQELYLIFILMIKFKLNSLYAKNSIQVLHYKIEVNSACVKINIRYSGGNERE